MYYGSMHNDSLYYEYTCFDYFSDGIYYEDPPFQTLIKIKSGFLIVQVIAVFIELIFFFVMIRNWLLKNSVLRSPFFYLTTFKITNDFLFLVYTVVIRYWSEELNVLVGITEFLFYAFNMEIDTLCQLAIAVNRYTALVMPVKHERVSVITYLIYKYLKVGTVN